MAGGGAVARAGLAWAAALGGCAGGDAFFERPGGVWVEALAGCTWEQADAFGQTSSWRYDTRGRLVEFTVDAGERYRTVLTWSGACLIEQRWLELDLDVPHTSSRGFDLQYTECDPQGNPVWRDDVVTTGRDEWVIASRSFVNEYSGAPQVSRVERWSEPGPGAERELLDTTEYLWHDERKPLRVRQANQSGTATTTTYWWDHHLLLGSTTTGAGSELEVTRTFERRRLVSEGVTSGDQELSETTWSFADGEAFPYEERVEGGGVDFAEYDLSVDCP
jgi:YD repeat-containing protein